MAQDLTDRSYDDLFEMAAERGIDARFKMNKKQLIEALQGEADGTDDLDAKTKSELEEMARAQDVEGRSSMTKDELVEALRKVEGDRRKAETAEKRQELEAKTKDELMEIAQDRDIEGRSSMNKDELVDALAA
ncbi:MAG: Rho termination factor N-terminal domain-containing protein [Shimia sp.]